MTPKTSRDILLEMDILPVGDFETRPVRVHGSGRVEDYPSVVFIKDIPEIEELVNEAGEHIEKIGHCFIQERLEHIDPRIPKEQLREILGGMGFLKDQYQNYSLRDLGTNTLRDFVGPHTRRFFAGLGIEVFRQQYGLAQNGWRTEMHRDHDDLTRYGFRGMMPLNAPVYLGYEEGVYKLEIGRLYFINVARLHRGFVLDGERRLNLMFQMATDELVLQSLAGKQKPMTDVSAIPAEFIS